MSLQNEFKTFVSNISNLDFEDIDTKYKGITKKLNSYYYKSDSESDNSKKVGSIGRGTAIKGIMRFQLNELTSLRNMNQMVHLNFFKKSKIFC